MSAHDWKRVSSGTFHAFHTAWLSELQKVLNAGLLPKDYYVLAEQLAGEAGPDMLALHSPDGDSDWLPEAGWSPGGLAIADTPPKVALRSEADESLQYTLIDPQIDICA